MKNKFILLLGANQFQRERALIGAERAFRGTVLTISPQAPFHSNKYPSITIKSNENNPEILLQNIQKFVKKYSILPAAVIPLNDFVLNSGLNIAEHYNLPYNSAKTITTARTKDLMKSALLSANIPVVQSYRFSTQEEARRIANQIGYPVVIKPVNFGGSGGVYKVENESEINTTIEQTQAHLKKYAVQYDSDPINMLIEPYIRIKREVSVEIINTPKFRNVIGITDKFLSNEPQFSEIAHSVPSSIHSDTILTNKISDMAIKACEALDIQYGMAHVEIKIDSNGEIIVIEVGARTAGDGIMDLYEKATGKNIYELHCKAFLGTLNQREIPTTFKNKAAIGYLHPKPGIIENINLEILDESELENIDLIAIRSQIGQEVLPPSNWSTRYGFVEYTFPNDISINGFDPVKSTDIIANKIFQIKE